MNCDRNLSSQSAGAASRGGHRLAGLSALTEPGGRSGAGPDGALGVSTRVLCVDDSDLVRQLIARMLSQMGCEVTTAANGLEAWTELQSREFDLVLTDCEMPCMRGADLARKARGHGMTLPIILMSAGLLGTRELPEGRLKNIGFLEKPFSVDELNDALVRACGSPREAAA